jgi:hypothetical protein
MAIQFRKAERKKAKLRLALCGPSGSGKTYSALLVAKGLGGKVAVIDTERGSSELYSHIMDFDVCELDPPYTPQKYIAAIRAAENAGYDVIIIDSLSHAWAGDGGILDMHSSVAERMKNSFSAWREVTPFHNQLVDTMLHSRCHIIATIRAKMDYVVEEGGKKVRKVGLAPIQRDGLEYEFTIFGDLAVTHSVTITKDRTGQWQDRTFIITPEFGEELRQWLESGAPEKGFVPAGQGRQSLQPGQQPPQFPAGQQSVGKQEASGGEAGQSVDNLNSGQNDGKTHTFRLIRADRGNRNGKPFVKAALQDENNQVITGWAAGEQLGIADVPPGTLLEVVLEERGKCMIITGFRVVEDARGEVA